MKNSKNNHSIKRKPPWIRSQLSSRPKIAKTEDLLRKENIVTVCEEANCPNKGECFCRGTATFLILGNTCTRNCRFCNVKHGKPNKPDQNEPIKIAKTVAALKLKYVVLTSVDRDDLPDGGANHFANCIKEIRNLNNKIKIEILTPDFRNCLDNALAIFKETQANVFNHNIETVPRLYKSICPSANYSLSLNLLKKHKQQMPNIPTKSGIMVGLGETDAEIIEVMKDLRENNVNRITIGQYLQPTINHLPVDRYVTPEQFKEFAEIAKKMGFDHAASAPMVRSSYNADKEDKDTDL